MTPRLAAALQQATFSLPDCTFVPAILSVWKTHRRKSLFILKSQFTQRVNFPFKPPLSSSDRLRTTFPAVLTSNPSPRIPHLRSLSHSKNDFFKGPAQIKRSSKIRLVLFHFCISSLQALNRCCVKGSTMSKGALQTTNLVYIHCKD